MKKILSKLKTALTRSRENIKNSFNKVILSYKKIDEDLLESLEEILIHSDMGMTSAQKILEDIRLKTRKGTLKDPQELMGVLQTEISSLLADNNNKITDKTIYDDTKKPFIIMVVGVNGVGKTTTIGKLAYYYRQVLKKNVMVAAADTFRAAAIEQLEVWSKRADCDIVKQSHGSDAASVAYDALAAAKARNHDVVIIDTAGRLHTKTNLMEELKKIKRVIGKIDPEGPHRTLLVIDSNTGQNALQQAKEFNKAVQIDGLVLTKLDSTAKGGIVISIKQNLNIPVYFIGIGEQIEDLQVFNPEEFAQAIINDE